MCHGQVVGQTVLSIPATCQGCGSGPGAAYQLRWREKGEVRQLVLCPSCAEIELRRPK